MRVALYIRVSTQEQVENYSIEGQRERLEAYCKSKGWIVHDVYIDGGYSGATLDRPDLQRMLNDLDKFDAVMVYRLDRLSRSQRDTLTLIEEHFLKNNVDFVSITETLDTSTPFGKAMIGILSVFAQLERETIAERMRMGQIKRAEEGHRNMGGDYDPAGYKRENGKLVVIEEEAQHIRLAYDLYEQYASITKVQKRLKELGYKVWRFRRYRDILGNKLYCGYVSFAGVYYKGLHPAIITEEQYERVQILLSRHKGRNANKAKESLFSGLIICGRCGESYVSYHATDNGKKYKYYICRAKRFPSEYDEKCMNDTWSQIKLENLIMDELQNLAFEKRIKTSEKNLIDYDKLIKKVDIKIERLLNLYLDGNLEKNLLDKQIEKLNQEKQTFIDLKRDQENDLALNITAEQLHNYTIDLSRVQFSDKQAIIQKLIRKITIDGKNVQIEWSF